MSDKQHQADLDNKLKHVEVAGNTDGGHCLNRHMGRAENSCSHQWQGYKRACADNTVYDWPKYQNIGGQAQVMFKKAEAKGQKVWKWVNLKQPGAHDWDVDKRCPRNGKTNHKEHCNTPYYHEAHHVVPNSTLNGTIQELFGSKKSVLRRFRKGLLDEGYNLNHKDNMILLPLDKAVGKALNIPCHRELQNRAHKVYSDQVKVRLKKILSANQQDIDKHKSPKYTACKAQIVTESGTLYDLIKAAGALSSLDNMVF